jgi:uncharacterized RDD family membrane protein YckC
METGAQPPDRPREGEPDDPVGSQEPQPPAGPPPPSPPPATGEQPPAPGPQSPAPGPQAPGVPGYVGPVPPGGWQQPPAPPPALVGAQLASWGSRVGATLLDILILLIPYAVLAAIVVGAFAGSDTAGIVVLILSVLAYFAITLLYAPLLMARKGAHNGQTFGKQVVGIRAVRDSGQPFELGWAFLREFVVKNLLFGGVGGLFFGIPWLLDNLWPLWDDQNRALHDMLVSTHVVASAA